MDSTKLRGLIISILAVVAALYLGLNAATAQLETVMWVIGAITIVICCMLGKRIWLILPFMMSLNLALRIPGNPDTALIAQGLFVGFSGLLFLLKRLPFQLRFSELDLWSALLTMCVLQAYVRNPVGLNIIGGDSVGGRPYAVFGATLVTSFILSNLIIQAKDLKWIIKVSILGGIGNFLISSVGHFVPRFGIWFGTANLSDLHTGAENDAIYGIDRATRVGFLGNTARLMSLLIGSFKSPIRACFHPFWAPLILLTFAFASLSGFRNEIAAVGLTYLVAIAYRGGFISVLAATTTLATVILMLSLINLAVPLPSNIQRSLSFLPGTWDEVHVIDAEESTAWRVDMWKEALLTNFWIKNKFLGDGLGMTQHEFNYIQELQTRRIGMGRSGTGKLTLQQEYMMASNAYHSGPVSTIRAIGYFGLAILLIAQIRLAMHAHKVIKRAKRTNWLPLTLFVSIPIIWSPIFFVLVIGDFATAISGYLMGAAWIKVLSRNIPFNTDHTVPSST